MCHQTVGLTARHLEASGMATVIMGCAKDIVEHCGVPRFHGAPTNRSHRETEADLAELLRRCREDGADAAVLVPS